jgi:hypothetical protein
VIDIVWFRDWLTGITVLCGDNVDKFIHVLHISIYYSWENYKSVVNCIFALN